MSQVFLLLSVLALSVAVGLGVHHHMSQTVSLPPFDMTKDGLMRWLCNDGSNNCFDGTTAMVPELKQKLLLRFSQLVWDVTPGILAVAPKSNKPEKVKRLVEMLRHPRPSTIQEAVGHFRAHNLGSASDDDKYPYFGFLPNVVGSLIPGGAAIEYSSPCFTSISAAATWSDATHVLVQINTSNQVSFLCTDHMLIDGQGAAAFPLVDEAKTYSFLLDVSATMKDPSRAWLLTNRGVLVARFNKSFIGCILDLIPTVTLIMTFEEARVTKAGLADNLHFIRNYIEFSGRMQPKSEIRSGGAQVARELDPSVFESGDALFVQRPDGLDPIIGWAEGGTPGHTTIAMRDDAGVLHICESTAKDAYWPLNGIQCHKWEDWWQLAARAQYNVVLLPLSAESRAKFNRSAAWDWFHKTEGLDYGYSTMLFGWLDTALENSPCLPPDFQTCFVPDLMQMVAFLIDDLMGDNTENMFRQGLNHRLGLWPQNYSLPQGVVYAYTKLGMKTFPDLYSIPENDEWDYNTTRDGVPTVGKSQVCNVFVCNMYKHGGLFDGIDRQLNCAEQTLWGVFSMDLFDSNKTFTNRPAVCQQADPNNQLCQLMGNFTFHLKPDFNTRPPYKWMGNYCPSKGPDYFRPERC
jgi:hypothetical protein